MDEITEKEEENESEMSFYADESPDESIRKTGAFKAANAPGFTLEESKG